MPYLRIAAVVCIWRVLFAPRRHGGKLLLCQCAMIMVCLECACRVFVLERVVKLMLVI